MRPSLSLFHCDSQEGNRAYEDQFQWFAVSRDKENHVQRMEPAELEKLLTGAKDQCADHGALLSLAKLLGTCLEPEAYDLFIENFRQVVIMAIFFDYSILKATGVEEDFEQTKASHYRKYRLYKFASFLELLCPGSVHWRGQAELESEQLVCVGLDRFDGANLQSRVSILSRWIRDPGLSAFSEKRSRQSRRLAERRAFLLKLPPNLTKREKAARLDHAGFRPPRRKYTEYTEWSDRNPNSFASWLSRELSESRKMWRPFDSKPRKPKLS